MLRHPSHLSHRLTALLVVLLCGLAAVAGQGRSPAHRLLQPRYRDLPRPLLLPPAPEKVNTGANLLPFYKALIKRLFVLAEMGPLRTWVRI